MSSGRKSPTFIGKVKPHVTEDRLTDSMGVPGPGKYYNPTKTSAFGRQQKSQKKSSGIEPRKKFQNLQAWLGVPGQALAQT